jgi:hypothetical protein
MLVQRGAIRTMAKPPSDNIRLTITVSPDVHAAFSRMAQASSLPIGRCMGEWLADTLEGVEFVTAQMVKAREAPRQVVREMRQGLLGLVDETNDLLTQLRAAGKVTSTAPAARSAPGAPGEPGTAAASPRPVIRGGKSPGKTRTQHPPKPKAAGWEDSRGDFDSTFHGGDE